MSIRSAVAVAVLVVAATASPVGAARDRGNVDGVLTVGSLAPETGDLSPILESLRVPVQIAVNDINQAGGVNDAPVALVTGDDGSDVGVATGSLTRMANTDRVDAVVGPALSPIAEGVLDLVEENQLLMCSGSNTLPTLSAKGIAGGYYIRTSPPDRLQSRATARLVAETGAKRIAILAIDDAYGAEYMRALKKALGSENAKIVADVAYDARDTSFGPDARRIAKAKPDTVVLIAFPDAGAKLIQALIAAGVGPDDVSLIATDSLDDRSLPSLVDPANPGALDGLLGTTPASAPAGIDHPFYEAFAPTGIDVVFSPYYYDCTIILALAAESAGTDAPAKIRKHITKVLEGKTSCSSYADCKEALDAGRTINYDGAASDYAKFSDHEPLVGTYDVYTFDESGTKSTLGADAQIHIR